MPYDEDYWGQSRVCCMTPTEFEEYCCKILLGYGEEEKLPQFSITHNVKLTANDGTYQIDVYATYTALGAEMKVIAECKQYKNRVNRDKVVLLADKVRALGAQKGILLSTAGFQSGAIKYAKEHGIALVQVFDTRVNWYSHSGGSNTVLDEEDPMIYGERHMPIFQADLITTNSGETKTIYPTKAMVKEIYLVMDKLMRKKYGRSIFPNQEQHGE
ncbi:MAG: restriction endonuclease [Oscillibacter sp.]|nr:restriction endonuclease [Oscillibacter sp.]